jgi:hypothetical protein
MYSIIYFKCFCVYDTGVIIILINFLFFVLVDKTSQLRKIWFARQYNTSRELNNFTKL